MSRPSNLVPTMRHHKATGRAFILVHGKTVYLGKWGSKAAKVGYARFIAEWAASDGFMPVHPGTPLSDLLVAELIVRYVKFANRYYVKNGKQTDTVSEVKSAMKPLRELYGKESVGDFTPVRLKAVRQIMLDGDKLARTSINKRVDIIRRMFKWGVAEGMVEETVYRALMCIDGLKAGRTKAREPEPVLPVADEVIEATLPHCPVVIRDMVRVQRLCGCRPGEVIIMRAVDIDTTGDVWRYVPEVHKTEHHGRDRTIFLGPKAQAILTPYMMEKEAGDYLFSPIDSEKWRRRVQHANRKTPLSCGNRPGTNRKRKPKLQPRDHYDVDGYRRAIDRACKKAGVPSWAPNQLRHTAGTMVREQFGLEAAQVTLGHASANITQVYAERDTRKAAEVARAIG